MNRREFIVGAGAALASPFAIGKPVRSSLGADNGSKAAEGWTNPYVTDGMIAMWDAEWNAGGGVHDSSLFAIRDLVGSSDIALSSDCVIGSNSISFTPSNPDVLNVCGGITHDIENLPEIGEPVTNEAVGTLTGGGGWDAWRFIFAYRDGCAFCYNTRFGIYFGKYRNSESSKDMVGGFSAIDSATHTLSYSSRTVAWNDFYYYINGQEYTAGGQNMTYTPSDSKVRILTSTIASTMAFNTLRIYNRSLTAAEIAENHSVDKERFGL